MKSPLSLKLRCPVPTPTSYPSLNEWPFRGWCIDIEPGVYFTVGLKYRLDTKSPPISEFEITDYTVGSMTGKAWTIRITHLESDVRAFWSHSKAIRRHKLGDESLPAIIAKLRRIISGEAIKVVVLKTAHMETVVETLSALGLTFVPEKHGDGPEHFACEANGVVFEIYPGEKAGGVKLLEGFE